VPPFYKLDGKIAVPVDNLEHQEWMLRDPDHGRKSVQRDLFEGDILVSTVFLMGINHNFNYNDDNQIPLLFETMILGGPLDGYQTRHSTWEEAEAGHLVALEELYERCPGIRDFRVPDPPTPPEPVYPTRFERILKS
jgi:hypothetical protein